MRHLPNIVESTLVTAVFLAGILLASQFSGDLNSVSAHYQPGPNPPINIPVQEN